MFFLFAEASRRLRQNANTEECLLKKQKPLNLCPWMSHTCKNWDLNMHSFTHLVQGYSLSLSLFFTHAHTHTHFWAWGEGVCQVGREVRGAVGHPPGYLTCKLLVLLARTSPDSFCIFFSSHFLFPASVSISPFTPFKRSSPPCPISFSWSSCTVQKNLFYHILNSYESIATKSTSPLIHRDIFKRPGISWNGHFIWQFK